MRSLGIRLNIALQVMALALACLFCGLHFVHLPADFPNHSPWMDWAKYTDEGWYGDAAIRHFELGHWYVPGDFNPAAALPVWPTVEGFVFLFTGVSLLAARALSVSVFIGSLITGWFLVAGPPGRESSTRRRLAASAGVVLLAVSPFCFAFSRLAIIEPLLILLTALALLVASGLRLPDRQTSRLLPGTLDVLRRNRLRIPLLGALLPAMVLSKTTAVFLLPAVLWMIFAAAGYRLRDSLKLLIPIGTVAAALWLGYLLLIIRPHYLADYRYLFSANAYTGMTRSNVFEVLKNTVRGGMWMDRRVYPAGVACLLLALVSARRLKSQPLIVSLSLWVLGYGAFLAYHNNLQPRYYLVVAVPLTLLVPLAVSELVVTRLPASAALPAAGLAAVACLAAAIPDAVTTVRFLRHPEYTLLNAARQVRAYIDADLRQEPGRSPLVLSISGSELSLMTGLPSICDDFGTLELEDRVKRYRPGWYLAWNEIDDDKMDALSPLYHPVRVATFPAMDDPERNLLVLYRLDPATPKHTPSRRRTPIPRALRTRFGEQPSVNQLEH